MSQLPNQSKLTTSRTVAGASTSTASGSGSRLLLNYPQEPIGTRPSYVGELVAILRDGTQEMRSILETECDLRFNCKVCGSILSSTRSFVIHKRQFCTTKYVEYQRRNVSIMERISNVVSFKTKGLQTEDDMLELDNPINACLLIPLSEPPLTREPLRNGISPLHTPLPDALVEDDIIDVSELKGKALPKDEKLTEQVMTLPVGVEIIQPARPPADGVYRFGMGGISLLASRKKKSRVHASGQVKKKRKQVHIVKDSFSASKKPANEQPKPLSDDAALKKTTNGPVGKKSPGDTTRSHNTPIMTVTKPSLIKPLAVVSMECDEVKAVAISDDIAGPSVSAIPQQQGPPLLKRSRRHGPLSKTAAVHPVVVTAVGQKSQPGGVMELVEAITNVEQADRTRDVKDPAFIRRLLGQMSEVADYQKKTCRECNRMVVSVYNLDRHVATQHLGLRESEYSLISKELRRLRAELFGSQQMDSTEEAVETCSEPAMDDNRDASADMSATASQSEESSQEPDEEPSGDEQGDSGNNRQREPDDEDEIPEQEDDDERSNYPTNNERSENGKLQSLPLPVPGNTSKPSSSDSESITERLTAMMRNPDTLKEILTMKEKEQPLVDYELEQLVDMQRQIIDAADPYLQCCRICKKQYFDVYVLNRHVMTVHLRLPERSCGAINKLIKDNMKRYPHAFGAAMLNQGGHNHGSTFSQPSVSSGVD